MSVVDFFVGPFVDKRILEAHGIRVGSAHRIVLFLLSIAYAHHLWFYRAPLTQADATIVLFMLTGIGINEKMRQANPDTVIRAIAAIPGSLGSAVRGAYRGMTNWGQEDIKGTPLIKPNSTEILTQEDLEPGGRPTENDDGMAV